MHKTIDPAILYFGTPVVLISTLNEDGSANLAPMSSAWWIGNRCVLGLANVSKTTENLLRTGECVLNLPSARQVTQVDALALTTGSNPVPAGKKSRGYRFEPNKFEIAGLTRLASETIGASRAAECPVQLEARLHARHDLAKRDARWGGRHTILEVEVTRVHVAEDILRQGKEDHVDPDKWRPLVMSFQNFYGLAPERLQPSTLATIPEHKYRPT